jgi:hypothetical protein
MQILKNEKEWYNKREILEIYPIGISTYKKRIKKLREPQYSGLTRLNQKELPNSNLKVISEREIHRDILDNIFGRVRLQSLDDLVFIKKWVNTNPWNWFCNIIPSHTYPRELESKINFIFKVIKKRISKKNELVIFYSIEKTEKDGYYHSHFLIRLDETILSQKQLIEILELVCEPNNQSETRIFVKPYDFQHYRRSGTNYTMKDFKYGYGILK